MGLRGLGGGVGWAWGSCVSVVYEEMDERKDRGASCMRRVVRRVFREG